MVDYLNKNIVVGDKIVYIRPGPGGQLAMGEVIKVETIRCYIENRSTGHVVSRTSQQVIVL